jgi:DNA-binding NarL/FixJ family response regulator
MLAYLRHFLAQTRLENKIFQDGKSYSLLNLSDQDLIIPDVLLDFKFSTRDGEIAIMILEGSSYSDIAGELYLAYSTISKYASTIFKKVGANNLLEFRRKFHAYSKSK